MNLVRGGASSSPASLFAAAEPGAWYDPSDLTTLFQDSAGTTPVTAVGQTVGRILDKSGRGNHATQATSTQRPIYGINPITGTRNLLTYTEQFDNAPWTKFGTVTVTPNDTVAPDGTTTADKVAISTSSGIFQAKTGQPLLTYTASVWVRADSNVTSRLVVNTNLGDAVFLTINATTTWQRVSLSKTTIAGTNSVVFQVDGGNGANTIYLWGAQVEQSATATAYQKVVSQYEVTQAGVASASYLAFDGVDDGMVTGTITPGIDKVQVFAGVRKLSDVAGIIYETSVAAFSNAGAISAFSGYNGTVAGAYWSVYSHGSAPLVAATTGSTFAAPNTAVVTQIADIAAPTNTLRVNATQQAAVTTTQGTGNYLAYPLYIGRRGGTALPYNGRIYSLIVRFGANLTTGQITSTESWVNGKTGAY